MTATDWFESKEMSQAAGTSSSTSSAFSTWRQVFRDRAPLAARAQDVHQTVGDLAQVHRALITAQLGRRDMQLLHDYFDLWSWDGTLDSIHHALYVECRERAQREASPTAAIIDSQSVKSSEKGGLVSTRMATMPARRSRARSGIFSSTRKAS